MVVAHFRTPAHLLSLLLLLLFGQQCMSPVSLLSLHTGLGIVALRLGYTAIVTDSLSVATSKDSIALICKLVANEQLCWFLVCVNLHCKPGTLDSLIVYINT